jgi:HD-GYP domain
MKLADNLYGKSGEILLTKGTLLTKAYLISISRLKYNGLYIDDDSSKDIEIVNVIDEDLRRQTVNGIKNIFIAASDSKSFATKTLKNIESLVESIVDEVMKNQNVVVNMVDIKVFDDYTYYHSVNVAVLSIVMGVALHFERRELHNLCLGALLHDIGKVFVSKEILNKEGDLTNEEFEEVKKHPRLGYDYMEQTLKLPNAVMTAILDHHEKYDGTGYPDGRTSKKISLFGKIIALTDVYDALTSDRPYKKAILPSEAFELIMGSSGVHFEPDLVNIFLRKIAPYPIGTIVKLSNDYSGIVVENHEDFCLRPTIKVLQDKGKDVIPFKIDLVHEGLSNITIVGIA